MLNIGDKYGRLTVMEMTNKRLNRSIVYKCKCACGNVVETTGTRLKSGLIKSCGCYQKEMASKSNKTHGMSKSKLFMVWQDMIARCTRKTHHAYKYYGGRGISVFDDWKNNFESFHNWAINNGYYSGLTIDRINNDGNYEPSNCRWVTMKVQSNNRRKPIMTYGKNPNAKKVVKLTLNGDYICSYDCIKNAMIDNDIDLLSSSISACCKHKQKSAYGYRWLYYDEWENIVKNTSSMVM